MTKPSETTHPAAADPEQLMRECTVERVRRSGPGGQRRNKVETGVVLRHRPTGIEAQAGERRSQDENRRVALKRLRVKLALQVRRVRDPQSPPSRLWQQRCRQGTISVNVRHADFPAMLAEALDVIASRDFDVKAAAAQLQCTGSQLVKLLKAEPHAWELVNGHRRDRGLRPLR